MKVHTVTMLCLFSIAFFNGCNTVMEEIDASSLNEDYPSVIIVGEVKKYYRNGFAAEGEVYDQYVIEAAKPSLLGKEVALTIDKELSFKIEIGDTLRVEIPHELAKRIELEQSEGRTWLGLNTFSVTVEKMNPEL